MEGQNAPVEIKGMITSLNANYRPWSMPEQWNFPSRPTATRRELELDTEHITMGFVITSYDTGNPVYGNNRQGTIPMKRDDVKKLGLMVGDSITLKVSR